MGHDFHSSEPPANSGFSSTGPHETCANRGEIGQIMAQRCTKTGHKPVDGVHVTDVKGDKISQFSLTLKIEGVKRHSFFDTF
jgi:hypothetical protein